LFSSRPVALLILPSIGAFLFLAYFLCVAITIELPDLQTQTRFNLVRWGEVLADPVLAKLPNRIETDRHGYILMRPPPAYRDSRRQGRIIGSIISLLCPDFPKRIQ
jgi:hypothetical protein